jgi:hypothetical protein
MDYFAKLNVFDSSDVRDLKRYTTASANLSNLPENQITIIDYFTTDEVKYAELWPDHFQYHIHELGFRFKELPKEVDIAVFGCSFTFGIGLPEEMLWHHFLGQKTNSTILNFGLPGASVLTTTEIFNIASNHVKFKKAIFLLPSHNRLQIAKKHPTLDEVNYISIIASYNSSMCNFYGIDDQLIFKALPEEELLKQFRNSLYIADYFAHLKNIKTYYSSWDAVTYQFLKSMNLKGTVLPDWRSESGEQAERDLARDRKHPGVEHHSMFADKIFEYIK